MNTDSFDTLRVTCIPVPLASVVEAARRILLGGHAGGPMREETAPFDSAVLQSSDWRRRGPPHGRKAIFLEPVETSGWTAMVANLDDGWATLGVVLSKELECCVWRFALDDGQSEYPLRKIDVVCSGQTRRVVQVLREDDGWKWFQKGEPLPGEDADAYERRRVSDRLTNDAVVKVATSSGFALNAICQSTHATAHWFSDAV
jgi:hypothetical protein